ncbi:phage tail tape measure protein [Streptomyces tsukubensis]
MTLLSELLVGIGVRAEDLSSGAAAAADDVEESLADVAAAADRTIQDVAAAADSAGAAMDGIGDGATRAAAETGQAAGQIAVEITEIADAADRAASEVRQAAAQAENAVEGIGDGATRAAAETEQAAGQMEQSLGGMQALAAGAAVGALFMTGLTNAMDAKHANARLVTQLNLSAEEAKRAGAIAGKVYSAGFSDSIDGVNDAIAGVASSMGGLGAIGDAELQQMTKSAIILGDAFEMDVGEASTAAGALIKQGLVKDGTEAFDVLTKAAQILPKSMAADIPAIVTEYGTHLKRIGLDARDAFGMMSQYVQAGGRDIDQAADVLHEFARITSEETDRAADGFKALGLPAKQMLADIGKGGEPAQAALQKTIDALRGVKDPAKQAQLGVALFGDMAGESAQALWAMDPATAAAKSGMDQAAGAAEKATDAMAASQSFEAIWRTLATTLGEALAPALKVVGTFLAENPALIKVLVPVLLGLALAIGVAVVAQWAWNTALWAFPGTWIIAGIIALIAVIVLIVVYWDEIAAATASAWDWIVSTLSDAWNWIKSLFSDAWSWVTQTTGEAWDWVSRKVDAGIGHIMTAVNLLGAIPGAVRSYFGAMISDVAAVPGKVHNASKGMWDGIVSSFKSAINELIWMWNSLSFTIGGGSFLGADIPSLTLHTPDIPYLAEGGITTGPTLAMIGEGREQEAVLPLSKLDGMLRGVVGAVRSTGGGDQRVVLEITGGDTAFVDFLRSVTHAKGGGSIVRLAEG